MFKKIVYLRVFRMKKGKKFWGGDIKFTHKTQNCKKCYISLRFFVKETNIH